MTPRGPVALRNSLFLVFLLLCCGFPVLAVELALAPGDQAPPLRGNRPDGEIHKVDYTANKVTVVNFWATWCVPCKDEMPELQALHEKHGADGLGIVGVVKGNDPDAAIQNFCDSLGVRYPVIRTHRGIMPMWRGVGALPATFLIDGSGKILRRYVGATAEQIDGLVYDIEAALAGKPLGPFIFPEKPAVATDEDRRKALKEQE